MHSLFMEERFPISVDAGFLGAFSLIALSAAIPAGATLLVDEARNSP
jgi:hypothetical protein